MNANPQIRPRFADYVGDAGAFVEAMRQFNGLGYRKFAQTLRQHVRGKARQGSENYLYRLCQGQTKLKPELVDGISRALALSDAESTFLRGAAAASGDDSAEQKGKRLLRALAADAQGQLDAKLARALVDPLVLAIYTLAGRGDMTDRQLLQALAKSASGAKITKPAARVALELLIDTGILTADANGRVRQSQPGVDLAVYADGRVGAGAKSEAMKLFYGALDAWGGKALYRVPRPRRRFLSTTFLVEGTRLPELNQELEAAWRDTVAKLRQKYESANGDTVMHTGLRAWPLLDATPIDKGARQ